MLSIYLARHGGTQLSRDGFEQLSFNVRVQIDNLTIATTISTSNTSRLIILIDSHVWLHKCSLNNSLKCFNALVVILSEDQIMPTTQKLYLEASLELHSSSAVIFKNEWKVADK